MGQKYAGRIADRRWQWRPLSSLGMTSGVAHFLVPPAAAAKAIDFWSSTGYASA